MRNLLAVAALLLVACDVPSTPPAPRAETPMEQHRAAERHIGISPKGGIVYCIGGCPGFGIDLFNGGMGFGF